MASIWKCQWSRVSRAVVDSRKADVGSGRPRPRDGVALQSRHAQWIRPVILASRAADYVHGPSAGKGLSRFSRVTFRLLAVHYSCKSRVELGSSARRRVANKNSLEQCYRREFAPVGVGANNRRLFHHERGHPWVAGSWRLAYP